MKSLVQGRRLLKRFWSFLTGPGSFYAAATIVLAIVAATILTVWLINRERTDSLILYSGQAGGTYQPLALEIASLLERENPKLKVEVRESEGSLANLRQITDDGSGNSLGIVQNDVVYPVGGSRNSPASLRSLLPLHEGVLHFLVPANSEIQGFSDLRGKTIAEGLAESGTPPIINALLNHYEIPPETVNRRYLSLEDACDAFRSGEVDAIVMAMGLKSAQFEKLVADTPLRFLGIGEGTDAGSEIEGFRLTYPFVQATTIPKYAYSAPSLSGPGVPEKAIPAISLRAVLVAHRELPDLMANRIARTLVESKSSLSRSHPSAAQITEHFDPAQLQFPIHRGAHRYFHRDDPGYLQKNAEVLGFLLSLLIALAGFFLSAKKWIQQLRKNRIDAFYIEFYELIEPLHGSRLGEDELETLDDNLWAMQRRAIRQLAREKLTADESFRIFQSLLQEGRDEVRRQLEKIS